MIVDNDVVDVSLEDRWNVAVGEFVFDEDDQQTGLPALAIPNNNQLPSTLKQL